MDHAELLLRPAEAVDAPAVTALVRQAYRGESSRAGWTTEADLLDDQRITEEEVRHKITRPDGTVLLAWAGTELIACCELHDRGDDLAYFGMFAVRPERQAGGLGRWLLARAEDFARRNWGTRTMEMTVIGQRSELIDWYLRRGYRRTGQTRPFPYDQLVSGQALRDDLYFTVLDKPLTSTPEISQAKGP